MPWKRKVAGGILAVLGFMLSPLSWWNDAFVNLPLALAFAWLVSSVCAQSWRGAVFNVAVVVGYWLTNVLGFVLLHGGARRLLTNADSVTASKGGELKKDLLVSLAYTALIVILIKLGVLKPIEDFFQRDSIIQ